MLFFVAGPGFAEEPFAFNPMFLSGKNGNVADLSWLDKGAEIPPGKYNTTIFINDSYIGNSNVNFVIGVIEGNQQLLPCFSAEELDSLGIDLTKAPKVALQKDCLVLEELYQEHGVKRDFDAGKMVLKYTLPQMLMLNRPRGYISPSLWESGINAAFLSYSMTGSRGEYRSENTIKNSNSFIGLNSGINLASWRFRDHSTWSWTNSQGGEWSHVSSALQRDIVPLRAQLTLGETWSSSAIFDSAGVRGVQLDSSENMLPNSLRGYAPEVRGIARTNATVRLRQNGNVIYQTSVTPGAFVINDLYPTSSGGDLEVTIEENDGQITRYIVPFASVPNLVREGQAKYSLSAGKFRGGYNQSSPFFLQGSLFYGWRYGLTFYSGVQYADNYRSFAAGIGQNLGLIGAYSLDSIYANSTLVDDKTYSGNSIRFRYAKTLNTSGTTLNFYSSRYTSRGFYTLADTSYRYMQGGENNISLDENGQIQNDFSSYYNLRYARKEQNQLTLSQRLGSYGSMSISYNQQRYWDTPKTNNNLQLSYSASWQNIAWNLAWQHNRNMWSTYNDNVFSLSLSMPLDKLLAGSRVRYSMTNSRESGTSHVAGVNGYVPGFDNFTYAFNARESSSNSSQRGADVSAQYLGRRGNYNAGYSYTNNSRYYNVGVNGGVVLHRDGITFSQSLGDTNILVKAPNAANVKITNQTGIYTDSRGYAVIPYASPYRENRVNLDVTTLGENVELPTSIVSKVPSEGAMVRATLETQIGYKAIFTLKRAGVALPFGTPVTLSGNKTAGGIVGESGMTWISGLPSSGTLLASWGSGPDQRCVAQFSLQKESYNPDINLYNQELRCE
ncbi:fimbria/pilus outer membrane usher protein [Phytobacter sp. V91]|uniref:fimbria/pilus outer membrane usher protein n=1 Tax=Phytobacter sp. V91 TaxID=3369425 RepID=UPI003F60836F